MRVSGCSHERTKNEFKKGSISIAIADKMRENRLKWFGACGE